MSMRSLHAALALSMAIAPLAACAGGAAPAAPVTPASSAAPCFNIQGSTELRTKDAQKSLEELVARIRLSPEDEALRAPKSLADVKTILHRDTIYLFPNAAAFAHTQNSVEGHFSEATIELLLGESQLVASQVLGTQAAWVGTDLRIARASLASEGAVPTTDRGRTLAQLIRAVEEGNRIADALGAVAPMHLARGADVIRALRTEAPTDGRTFALVAEYHRLRGEWTDFDVAMKAAEDQDRGASAALRYLRGMEQLERFKRPDQGAELMRQALVAFPRFVRAQAAIVLMATHPAMALRELQKLKAMNQDHYLVMLLEPTLAADQELTRMQPGAANAAH